MEDPLAEHVRHCLFVMDGQCDAAQSADEEMPDAPPQQGVQILQHPPAQPANGPRCKITFGHGRLTGDGV